MADYQEQSLRGRVFHSIRDGILQGEYKEHEELREIALAKELSVSRTPVREALRQLELEGLVKIVPNKGAYVTGITEKDIKDIYQIRSMLEGLCARWATIHITQEQLDELDEIILLSEFHIKRENSERAEQIADLDARFHMVLYNASQSRILSHVLTDFHKYVLSSEKNYMTSEERARKSIREHKQILRAIREQDADMAEQYANAHILNAIQHLKQQEREKIWNDAE